MIRRIENTEVGSVWDKVAPILQRCLDRTSTGIEGVRAWLDEGSYQLWIEDRLKAVCATSIDIYPDKKVCTVVYLAGKDPWEWVSDIKSIEGWAKSLGCDRIRINGRKEWSRVLPGYREVAVVSEKVL